MSTILSQLATIVGPKHVLTTDADTSSFMLDERQRYLGKALAVVLPGSTQEVVEVVRLARQYHIALVPQGGNTSTCGAATPDQSGTQLLVNMRRLRAVREVDTANHSMTVEAGLTLAEAQQTAQQANRLFPLSLASEGSCQIGGNISTNAGGLAVLRYGTMRELVLGLEVVMPDGSLLNALSGLRKDTSGLDVKQLFIGSEGQLGLITAATLKLFPLPTARATAWIGVENAEATIQWLNDLKDAFGDRLTTFEIMSSVCQQLLDTHHPGGLPFTAPWVMLVELSDSGNSDVLTQQLVNWLETRPMVDGVIAQSEQQRRSLWDLRESMSSTQKKDGPSIKHDIAVPSSAIPLFLVSCGTALEQAFPGIRIMAFGHAGDGNLHYNISYTRAGNQQLFDDESAVNQIVYEHVYRYNGTLAAEHGIGQLKQHWLEQYKNPVALSLMKTLKSTLDPANIMNPGKWMSS